MKYRINTKFAEEVFVPANSIEDAFYGRTPREDIVLVTKDGYEVKPTFLRTSNNKTGLFDEDFDKYCQEHFGMTFEYCRKIWFGRLGRVDDYWHFIKLEKI
jgi:hypothetical protein